MVKKKLSPVSIPTDAYFFVLNGNPEIIINSETYIANNHDFIFCPQNSTHCINNKYENPAEILIIKRLI